MRRLTTAQMKRLFDEASAGIVNSKNNPMVMEKVSYFGYNPDTFTTAEKIYADAEALYLQKGPKIGVKISLSIQLKKKINEINERYMLYVKLLRRELREDNGLLNEFQLLGERDHSFIGMVKEPKEFYKNCLDHQKLLTIVGQFGLNNETLQAQMTKIIEVESDKSYRALLVKEAEKTTEDRNKAILKLYDWWHNYKAVLIHCFKDDRQQLEAFMIKGYSIDYVPRSKSNNEDETPIPPAPVPPTLSESSISPAPSQTAAVNPMLPDVPQIKN